MSIKLTPTRARDYQLCPLQYQLRYLSPSTPAANGNLSSLAFGQSLHAALEALHENGSAEIEASDVPMLLRVHWRSAGYNSPEEEAAQFQQGVTLLQNYLPIYGQVAGEILAREVFLSRVVAHEDLRFELVCRADRIELHPDGRLEILDYKTNADGELPTATALSHEVGTFIYYLLTRIVYPKYLHVIVSQLNLVSLRKVTVDYTEPQRAANKATLLQLVRDIQAQRFEARPGAPCGRCAVRAVCPDVNTVVELMSL